MGTRRSFVYAKLNNCPQRQITESLRLNTQRLRRSQTLEAFVNIWTGKRGRKTKEFGQTYAEPVRKARSNPYKTSHANRYHSITNGMGLCHSIFHHYQSHSSSARRVSNFISNEGSAQKLPRGAVRLESPAVKWQTI